ncbi:hypothetical protein X732_32805 [Mesorhizobium sp. L2C066B000]|nr:hypothetical protein X732_32805 [Mesorhizobium sp. L2C066B000]
MRSSIAPAKTLDPRLSSHSRETWLLDMPLIPMDQVVNRPGRDALHMSFLDDGG